MEGGEEEQRRLEEAADAALQDFYGRWGLQAEAVELFESLSAETQQRVIQDFAPKDTSRDVNAIFMKFARSVAQKMEGGYAPAYPTGAVDGTDVLGFVEKWALGAEAQNILMNLAPELQHRVMKEFSPRDTSRDANFIFIKFAQGVAGGTPRAFVKGSGKGPAYTHTPARVSAAQAFAPSGGGYAAPASQRSAAGGHFFSKDAGGATPDVAAFIGKWSLQQEAQALLLGLDPTAQQKVMQEFAPRDTSRDVNAIFCKFAQGVAQREQGASVTKGFLARWNLGPDAQALFFGLRPDVQRKIIQEFAPRDTQSDANNIFMKFAQGVARAMDAGGQGYGGGYRPKGGGKGDSARYAPYN